MVVFFVFKQKTAYYMRISDWSSDVCSSDLNRHNPPQPPIPPSTAIPANDATTQRRNDATTQRRNESVSPKRYRARRVGSAAEARPAQPLGVWGSPPDTSRKIGRAHV